MFALRSIAAATRNMGAGGNAPASDTWWKNVVLLVNGDSVLSGASNSFFREVSQNALSLTPTGSVGQGTFTPVASNWSCAFNGAAGYSVTQSTIGTASFTIDCWFYLNTTSVGTGMAIVGAGNTGEFSLRVKSLTQITLDSYNQNDTIFTVPTLSAGQWYHLAAVRNGTTATVFLNGVRSSTGTLSDSRSVNFTRIGENTISGSEKFNGYISNLRVLKGVALYDVTQSSITVPTSTLLPIAGTTLLLFTGSKLADLSYTNNTLAVWEGTPKIVPFGPSLTTISTPGAGSSTNFNGSTDYLTTPSNSTLPPGQVFTFECWFNPTSTKNNQIMYGASTASEFSVGYNGTTSWGVAARGVSYVLSSSTMPTVGAWNHVAVTRNASNLMSLYLNGVLLASATVSNAFTTTSAYNIGYDAGGSGGTMFAGQISNVRLVKGSVVYNGNFNPPTSALTAVSGTVLLMDSSGTTTVDASSNAFALTLSGTPTTLQTFGPYWNTSSAPTAFTPPAQGGAVQFNGSSYVTIPASSNLSMPGDVTIEFWLYVNTLSAATGIVGNLTGSGGTADWAIMMHTYPGGYNIQFYPSTSAAYAYSDLISANTWYHVACVRSGTNCTVYLNGKKGGGVSTTSSANIGDGTRSVYIGQYPQSGTKLNGYVSNLRIVNGTALYNDTPFIPAHAPLSAISGTQLLTCQGSSIVDASPNAFTLTSTGTPGVKTFSPFSEGDPTNTGVTYFNGTSSYLSVPSSSQFNFTGDFTVEFMMNFTSHGAFGGLVSYATASGWTGWQIIWNNATNNLRFEGNNAAVAFNTTTTFSTNTWYHVALVRSGSTMKFYVNGVADATTATSAAAFTPATSTPLYIGAERSLGFFTGGFISDVHVVNGTALYTSNFTPRVSAPSVLANTKLLVSASTGSLVDTSTNAFAVSSVGSPAVYSSVNPYVSGVQSTYGSGYFTGAALGSYLTAPASTAYGLGTGNFTMEAWIYPTANPANGPGSIFDLRTTNGATPTVFRITSSRTLDWYDGTTDFTSTATVQLNTWSHVAVVRIGSTVSFYVNGVFSNSVTSSANLGSSNPLRIGANASLSGYDWNGYIYGARISKAALYVGNFTPSTTPQPLTSTVLLGSFADGAIYDASRNVSFTSYNVGTGSVLVQSSSAKFGSGGIRFNNTDGSNFGYLRSPVVPEFGFGTGDFTIEFWFNLENKGGSYGNWGGMVSFQPLSNAGDAKPGIHVIGGTLLYYPASATRITGPAISYNTWYHVAVSRVSGSTRMFVNGTQVGTTYADTTDYGAFADCTIGSVSDNPAALAWQFRGNIDDLRITKGVGRYTANFTAPTASLPAQ